MSKNLIVKYIKEKTEDIEKFIWENGTVFQQYNFLIAVGADYLCLVLEEENTKDIYGILPLVKTNKLGLYSYHIPPFAYQFGPVFSKSMNYETSKLFNFFYEELKSNHQLDFKFFINNQNISYYKNLNFSVEANQTFIIKKDSEFNLSKIHTSKRRYLKKLLTLLERNEIKVKTDQSCIKDLLEIYKINADEVGFKSNLKYLKRLTENLDDDQYFIHVLYSNEGKALAGTFCPYDRNSVYYLINASIKSDDKLLKNINILSTYLSIQKAREMNLDFDFEGSNILGVANYYQMMGGEHKINFRIQKTKSIYYNLLKGLKKIKQV